MKFALRVIGVVVAGLCQTSATGAAEILPSLRKVRDVVIYEDARFHAAFPSVVKRPDGTFIVSFRRAPDRQALGEAKTNHVDPNSQLMRVTSRDGETWTRSPALIYAHPLGGSQDPGLLQLRDGSLLCTSYAWTLLRPDGLAKLPKSALVLEGFVFLGGFVLRSEDGGNTWQGPTFPPVVPGEVARNPYGETIPAYNRGALGEGAGGRIFWVVASHDGEGVERTTTHLLISSDHGRSWSYSCPVAADAKVAFNETLRTAGLDGHACLARSIDGGRSFQAWQDLGFEGFPLHALRLPDQRVLLTYGYRQPPFGIRARVLNAECTDAATAPEIVLRADGGTRDLGYPWSVQLDARRVLVVYYFNIGTGPRHIAGTILEMN